MNTKKYVGVAALIIFFGIKAADNPENSGWGGDKLQYLYSALGAYGIAYGGYQLLVFTKTMYEPFVTETILRGYTENELQTDPLNIMSRIFFGRLSIEEFDRFLGASIPENSSDAEKSEYRKKALSCYNLYQFSVFRKMIRGWPEYHEHILQASERLKSDPVFYRILKNVQGFKKNALCAYIQGEARLVRSMKHEINARGSVYAYQKTTA